MAIHLPSEFGAAVSVPETGTSLRENALLKASAFAKILGPDYLVIGDDTGVEIEALGSEPGIYVRRWRDHIHDMTDTEIIAYCLEKMAGVTDRAARMHTSLATISDADINYFEGELTGHIVEKPIELRMEGFPFESLFYADEYQLMLGEIHQLSIEEKLSRGVLTHRERAFQNFLSWYTSQV